MSELLEMMGAEWITQMVKNVLRGTIKRVWAVDRVYLECLVGDPWSDEE